MSIENLYKISVTNGYKNEYYLQLYAIYTSFLVIWVIYKYLKKKPQN